jgi:hypothetical protein
LWRPADPTAALLRDVQTAFTRFNKTIFVRSLDAIHLLTAREEGFERINSNDRHLLAAASAFGLAGVNPLAMRSATPGVQRPCVARNGTPCAATLDPLMALRRD